MEDTHRQFWKHGVLGDIAAVEFATGDDGRPVVFAARYCSRPEELTPGALPVLTLHPTGEAYELASKSPDEFEVWEPSPTPDSLLREIADAIRERDVIAGDCTEMRAAERARQEDLKKADEAVRRLARRLNEDPASRPPLFALVESQPPSAAPEDQSPDVDVE